MSWPDLDAAMFSSFNASVGKRSSGTKRPRPHAKLAKEFQCLSRQTIKWNSMSSESPSPPGGFNASVGKRSSGTSIPPAPRSTHPEFQCLSRQTIKWNLSLGCVRIAVNLVSMPQSANDQVEHWTQCKMLAGLRQFQCLSRQTIKWNTRRVAKVRHINDCFNASVGKRSSGTSCGGHGWPPGACFNASVGKRSSGTLLVRILPACP